MRTSLSALALAAVMLTTACDRSAKTAQQAEADLARDLALANAQTTTTPSFQDTSVSPAPQQVAPEPKPETPPAPRQAPPRRRTEPTPPPRQITPTPAPEPQAVVTPAPTTPTPAPAPAPAIAEIAAGSAVGMTSGSKICTNSNLPGDKITATLSSAMTGTNGAVLPAGSTVVLELASASAGKDGADAQMTFRVRSVSVGDKTYEVSAEASPLGSLEQTQVPNKDPNAGKKKVIGGAIAGAILGQIIGKDTKGTVIGAAAGATAGAAASRMTQKWEACLPAGAPMTLKLTGPLVIS